MPLPPLPYMPTNLNAATPSPPSSLPSALSQQSAARAASSKPMRMSASEDAFVPDMDRRTAMNLILAGSIGINVLGLAVPYIAFFVPPSSGGTGGGVIAKDAIGNEVTTESWLASHISGSRELAEGIKVKTTLRLVGWYLCWSIGHCVGLLIGLSVSRSVGVHQNKRTVNFLDVLSLFYYVTVGAQNLSRESR